MIGRFLGFFGFAEKKAEKKAVSEEKM